MPDILTHLSEAFTEAVGDVVDEKIADLEPVKGDPGEKGDPGADGQPGPKGDKGDPGNDGTDVDPAVIAELTRRLTALEERPPGDGGTVVTRNPGVMLNEYVDYDKPVDQSTKLQEALTLAATEGRTLVSHAGGTVHISNPVTIGDTRSNGTGTMIMTASGGLKIKALTAMERMVNVTGAVSLRGLDLEVDGAGKASVGLYGTNIGRSRIGGLLAHHCAGTGFFVQPTGNNNAFHINDLAVNACSNTWAGNATLTSVTENPPPRADWTTDMMWATTDDVANYSTWTLAGDLPPGLSFNQWAAPMIRFQDGRAMQVRRVVNPTTIEVFNERRTPGTRERVVVYGAAINIPWYGDSGVWTMDSVDVRSNPKGLAMAYGGYGGFIGGYKQQGNGDGLAILKRASIGFGSFYTEASVPYLIVRDAPGTVLSIGAGTNTAPLSVEVMGANWMGMEGRNVVPGHWDYTHPALDNDGDDNTP